MLIFICGLLRKLLAHSLFVALFVASNGKTPGNKQFLSQKNDGIFHIFDLIKAPRVPL